MSRSGTRKCLGEFRQPFRYGKAIAHRLNRLTEKSSKLILVDSGHRQMPGKVGVRGERKLRSPLPQPPLGSLAVTFIQRLALSGV
ncbi:MAG TPA: hypothetical protein VFV58_07315 [Blastocatellia bacterium]|nr:hypothetical protein [Blastocatellia bacterium]